MHRVHNLGTERRWGYLCNVHLHAEALSIPELFPMDSQQHQLQLGGNTGRSYLWKLVFCYHLIVSGSACLHCKSEKGPAALPSVGTGAHCAEAFILCALQYSTGILYWSGREKSHGTSPSTTLPMLLSVPCDMGGGSVSHHWSSW